MNWLKSKFGKLWPLVLIAAMFILFLVFATKQENLDVYKSGNSTYTIETESESKKNIVSNTYLNNTVDLSMQIPDGWQHITKDGEYRFCKYLQEIPLAGVQYWKIYPWR